MAEEKFQASRDEAWQTAGLCARCDEKKAFTACTQCDGLLCASCDAFIHQGLLRNHDRRLFEFSALCPRDETLQERKDQWIKDSHTHKAKVLVLNNCRIHPGRLAIIACAKCACSMCDKCHVQAHLLPSNEHAVLMIGNSFSFFPSVFFRLLKFRLFFSEEFVEMIKSITDVPVVPYTGPVAVPISQEVDTLADQLKSIELTTPQKID